MKNSKSIESKLKEDIKELEKEELKLFHSYNRHASGDVKISILDRLKAVIIKLDALRKYNNS